MSQHCEQPLVTYSLQSASVVSQQANDVSCLGAFAEKGSVWLLTQLCRLTFMLT